MSEYEIEAECARENCNIPTRGGAKRYVGIVEDHQLVLPVLYGHTQHGGCGFHLKVDGEQWPT